MLNAAQTAPPGSEPTGNAFSSFLSGTPWIDMVGFGIVVLFLSLGLRHGLVWQVARLIGMAVAIVLARTLSPEFVPQVQEALSLPTKACQGIVWFCVFVGTLIVTGLIGMVARRTLEAVQLGTMDRLGGGLAGAFTGVIVHCALLVLLASVGTADWTTRTLQGSASANMLDSLSRKSKILLNAQAAERIMEPWGQHYDAELARERQMEVERMQRQSFEKAAELERMAQEERKRAQMQGYEPERAVRGTKVR
ncbi:MAG: CvpA family protein [Planctomycetota bacterium]